MELVGIEGAVALAMPYAVLALVILHTVVSDWLGRRRRAVPPTLATGRYGVPVTRRAAAAGDARRRDGRQDDRTGGGEITGWASRGSNGAAAVSRAGAGVAAAGASPRPRQELEAAIAKAEARGDEAAAAALYLEAARGRAGAGERVEAAELLRRAIRIAARLGLKEIHAGARLEIGDLARADGDLTTACEHWQIARGLYFDTGAEEKFQRIEERMRSSGCPTDWVLNDF